MSARRRSARDDLFPKHIGLGVFDEDNIPVAKETIKKKIHWGRRVSKCTTARGRYFTLNPDYVTCYTCQGLFSRAISVMRDEIEKEKIKAVKENRAGRRAAVLATRAKKSSGI